MLTCSHGHINVFVRVETIQCVHAASVGSWKSAGPMFTQKPQCVVYLYLRYLKRCMIKMNRPFSIAFHCGCILPFIWWINCAHIPYILSLGCTVHVSHYCHVYALLANGFICIFPWFNIHKKNAAGSSNHLVRCKCRRDCEILNSRNNHKTCKQQQHCILLHNNCENKKI